MLFVIGFIIGVLFLVMFFKSAEKEKPSPSGQLLESLASGVKTAIFIAAFVGLALLAAAPSFLGVVFLTTATITTVYSYLVLGFVVGLIIPSAKRLFMKFMNGAGGSHD
jgi:hypothetical protein